MDEQSGETEEEEVIGKVMGTELYCLVTEAHSCNRTTCLRLLCSFCPE